MKASTPLEFLRYLKNQSFSYLFSSLMAMLTFYVLIMFVVFPFMMVFFIIVQSITGEFPQFLPQSIFPYIFWYTIIYWIGYTIFNMRKYEERKLVAEVSQLSIDQVVELATSTDPKDRLKAIEIIPYHDYIEGILFTQLDDLTNDSVKEIAKYAEKNKKKVLSMLKSQKAETVNQALSVILAEKVKGSMEAGEFTAEETSGRLIIRNEGYVEPLNYFIATESTTTTLPPNFGSHSNLLTLEQRKEKIVKYNISTQVKPLVILTTEKQKEQISISLAAKDEQVFMLELVANVDSTSIKASKGSVQKTKSGFIFSVQQLTSNAPIVLTISINQKTAVENLRLNYTTKSQISDIKLANINIEVPSHKYFYLIKGEQDESSKVLFQITNTSDFLITIEKIKLSYTDNNATKVFFDKLREQLAYDQKMLEATSNTVIECTLDKHFDRYPKFSYEVKESVQHRFEFQTRFEIAYK